MLSIFPLSLSSSYIKASLSTRVNSPRRFCSAPNNSSHLKPVNHLLTDSSRFMPSCLDMPSILSNLSIFSSDNDHSRMILSHHSPGTLHHNLRCSAHLLNLDK